MSTQDHLVGRLAPRACAVVAASLLLAGCGPGADAPAPVPFTELTAVETPPPDYPPELACDDVGGKVILRVTVGLDGTPSSVEVAQSSRTAALDLAAQEAVRTWRFRPATRGGQPLEKTIQVPVTFTPPALRPDVCFALDEQRNSSEL